MSLSVHVSDATYGGPAQGVPLRCHRMVDGVWRQIREGRSDEQGDISGRPAIDPSRALMIELDLRAYFSTRGVKSLFSVISTAVLIADQDGLQRTSIAITTYEYMFVWER